MGDQVPDEARHAAGIVFADQHDIQDQTLRVSLNAALDAAAPFILREAAARLVDKYGVTNRAAADIRRWAEPS